MSKLVLFGRPDQESDPISRDQTTNLEGQPYELPKSLLLKALWAFARRKQRDTWSDATRAVNSLHHSPIVHGIHNVPVHGPIMFLPNHYERKDAVWVGWGAMALTAAVAQHRDRSRLGRMHWVMTDTWADCFVGPIHVDPRYLGWVLKGFGDIYGIVRMPAHDLPNHSSQRSRSARSLLEIFELLKLGDCVALHPEAGGFQTLVQPPAGAGRVVACIQRRNVPLIPVGIYEEDDRLVVNIGAAIEPDTFVDLDDRSAADATMLRIASLVPEETRGVYANRYRELVEDEQFVWREQSDAIDNYLLEA